MDHRKAIYENLCCSGTLVENGYNKELGLQDPGSVTKSYDQWMDGRQVEWSNYLRLLRVYVVIQITIQLTAY